MRWREDSGSSILRTRPTGTPRQASTRPPGLVGAGVLVFVVAMVVNFRVPVLGDLGDDLAMDAAQLGILTTVFALGRLVASLPAGKVVDRMGSRPAFVLAGLVLATGSGLLAASTNRWHAWGAAGLLGVAVGLASVAGMTRFATASTQARRGRTMAGFTVALLGGQAIGPAVSGVTAGLGGWSTSLWLGAAIGVGVVLAAARRGDAHAEGRLLRVPPAPPGEARRAVLDAELGRSSRLILASVPFSLAFAISALPLTVIPIVGSQQLGLSTATVGLALGLGGVARVLGSLGAGVLSDRWSRKVVLVPGLVVQAAGAAMLGLEGRRWAWVTSIVVMSLFSYGVATAGAMLGDRSPATGAGRRFAGFRLAADLGLLIGAMATGPLYAYGGQALAVLPTVTLLLGSAATVAFLVPETHTRADRSTG